jgi:flagellar basal-body rod protein FlgF
MDRLIYTAMSGAKHVLEQQATVSHNLSNASSTGFRAQVDAFRAVPVVADSTLPTRAFVVDDTVGTDFTQGPSQQTGRPLDVAVQNSGWIAVQTADGSEAYTRNGGLTINQNGQLQTPGGQVVQGDNGPIAVPPDVNVAIAADGTVGVITNDPQPGPSQVLGRIKLVNPPEAQLVRSDDGLFRMKDGSTAQADVNVKLTAGALEGSNVNPVDAMVSMISLSRQFEMQMSLLKNAENNASKATQILALS